QYYFILLIQDKNRLSIFYFKLVDILFSIFIICLLHKPYLYLDCQSSMKITTMIKLLTTPLNHPTSLNCPVTSALV
ncbi:hypothetical protein VIGAN_02216000, partial [Vigna angularis var. angularis]